jgi:hypothetical protein
MHMSDAAFATAKYPSYTTAQLEGFIAEGKGNAAMVGEIERRAAVAAGDFSRATPGERLRAVRGL